jgi:hypothetical protein
MSGNIITWHRKMIRITLIFVLIFLSAHLVHHVEPATYLTIRFPVKVTPSNFWGHFVHPKPDGMPRYFGRWQTTCYIKEIIEFRCYFITLSSRFTQMIIKWVGVGLAKKIRVPLLGADVSIIWIYWRRPRSTVLNRVRAEYNTKTWRQHQLHRCSIQV